MNACPAALRFARPTVSGLTGYIRRPGKRSASRQNGGVTGMRVLQIRLLDCHFLTPAKASVACDFSVHCAPRLIVCVMPGMAQGAHRGRPVAAALYPRLRPSKIAATRYLRLIPAGFGSGRGSVRCKTRPSARIHAGCPGRERLSDLRPSAPAVSATMVNILTTGRTIRRPGKRSATGNQPCNRVAWDVMNACPAALRLRGPTVSGLTGGIRRPGKAQRHPAN